MRHNEWRPWDDEQNDAIRAADADRDAAAEVLRKHHIAGRLTDQELEQRLDQCMSAKTLGDLRALVADLPGERRTREHGPEWRRRAPFGFPLLPVLVALILIVGAVGHHHAAWHGGGPRYGFPWLLLLVIAGVVFLSRRTRCGAWRAHRD